MTRMQATESKSHSLERIRVIDHWSMTRMQATGCKSHPVVRIRVIDHCSMILGCVDTVSGVTLRDMVNDTNAGY